MAKNFWCSVLGHKWELKRYMDQYTGEEVKEVVCKRCRTVTNDVQIYRRLTALIVQCDICQNYFMDNQGHVYSFQEFIRLKPHPHSKTAIQMTLLESLVLLGNIKQSEFHICRTCHDRDIPQ